MDAKTKKVDGTLGLDPMASTKTHPCNFIY